MITLHTVNRLSYIGMANRKQGKSIVGRINEVDLAMLILGGKVYYEEFPPPNREDFSVMYMWDKYLVWVSEKGWLELEVTKEGIQP